ncbi:MAG: phosphotransferase [Clostridiales bacterium]|nr:phosphotransferase [Clostridiales bacterium]
MNAKELISPIKQRMERLRGLTVTEIKYLGGGSYGFAFFVTYEDGRVEVVKGFRVAGMNREEACALELLRKASPLKVPEVYDVLDIADGCPVELLAMERIDGVNALSSALFILKSRKKKRRFADTVTDALEKIHETKGTAYGFLNGKGYSTWREFYTTEILSPTYAAAKALACEGKLKASIMSELERGIGKLDGILSEEPVFPVLLHGDLNVLNIMTDKVSFVPTGIIDPFNAMWGDKEYDLFQLNSLTGPYYRLFDTYLKKFKTSPTVRAKCAFYALVNEILCYAKSGWKSNAMFRRIVKKCKRTF